MHTLELAVIGLMIAVNAVFAAYEIALASVSLARPPAPGGGVNEAEDGGQPGVGATGDHAGRGARGGHGRRRGGGDDRAVPRRAAGAARGGRAGRGGPGGGGGG